MKRTNTAGYTLLEVAIALTILTVALGTAIPATRGGQQVFEQNMSRSVINTKTTRALNRIARALGGAGAGTVFPSQEAPLSSETISYSEVASWDGAVNWTSDFEIRLEYEAGEVDNNLDDDGDGFVDECRVVIVQRLGEPDEATAVIVNGVREFLEGEEPGGGDENGNGLRDERGLCFERLGNSIVIRLTVVQRDSTGLNLQTLETTVGLRN